jgi:hypothetical protein
VKQDSDYEDDFAGEEKNMSSSPAKQNLSGALNNKDSDNESD